MFCYSQRQDQWCRPVRYPNTCCVGFKTEELWTVQAVTSASVGSSCLPAERRATLSHIVVPLLKKRKKSNPDVYLRADVRRRHGMKPSYNQTALENEAEIRKQRVGPQKPSRAVWLCRIGALKGEKNTNRGELRSDGNRFHSIMFSDFQRIPLFSALAGPVRGGNSWWSIIRH